MFNSSVVGRLIGIFSVLIVVSVNMVIVIVVFVILMVVFSGIEME